MELATLMKFEILIENEQVYLNAKSVVATLNQAFLPK